MEGRSNKRPGKNCKHKLEKENTGEKSLEENCPKSQEPTGSGVLMIYIIKN
jgi:hypothetical protein